MTIAPYATCLDRPGVDPRRFFRVGDILTSNCNVVAADHHAYAATPVFNVELCGWPASNVLGGASTKPKDWTVTNLAGCPNVSWPFDPGAVFGAANGRAVRVSGVLVTDDPHNSPHNPDANYNDASQQWEGSSDAYDENNAARFTEIHSPDAVDLITEPQDHYLYGVAVSARTGPRNPSGADQALTVTLSPWGSGPPQSTLAVEEYVLPETYVPSIVEGNATKTGAALTTSPTSVQVHVKVHADAFMGHAGRFAAIYRLRWV